MLKWIRETFALVVAQPYLMIDCVAVAGTIVVCLILLLLILSLR